MRTAFDVETKTEETASTIASAIAAEKQVLSKRALFGSERIGLVIVGLAIAAGMVAGLAMAFYSWTGSQTLRLDPVALARVLYC